MPLFIYGTVPSSDSRPLLSKVNHDTFVSGECPPSVSRSTALPEASQPRLRRPFPPDPRTDIIITKGRYITSNDPRGYMCVVSLFQSFRYLTSLESPVYEYSLQGQWIMMDMDDGYILWTGIWKGVFEWLNITGRISNAPKPALGHSKGLPDKPQNPNTQ